MQHERCVIKLCYLCGVLNACASIVTLEEGRCPMSRSLKVDGIADLFVGSSLVDMYAKFGTMEDTWRVFNKMPSGNVVTWAALIFGHVRCRQEQKALELF